jgi:RNA polymerase sigma-70 factor (ECF subfamily)
LTDPKTDIARIFGDIESSLSRFLLRFLDRPEDVQDVMQEAYLRVHMASGKSRIRTPAAFIYRTAKNLALNERARHGNSRTSTVADFDELSSTFGENSAEFEAMLGQELAMAIRSLERLSPRVRETYILRKIHGLSQKQTAARLGISESTVEKHIASGLAALAARRHDE